MKLLELFTTIAAAVIVAFVAFDAHRDRTAPPAPRASCAQLLAASKTSADTVYVYVNRGDCAP